MNALHITGLTKSFSKFSLENINLELPQGYIMGLVGKNGAGKTTLFKTIMNHLLKDDGEIQIYGYDHQTDEAQAKSRIAYLSEDPMGMGEISLKTQKEAFASVYPDWDETKFQLLLSRFNLDQKAKTKTLSKGMKVKFGIALALSHNAKLILLDEPAAGLDPVARNEVMGLLQEELQDESKSILFSTHVTSDLDGIADYLTIIDQGQILMSENREIISDNWRILKLEDLPTGISSQDVVQGIIPTSFGYSLLTSDITKLRERIPADTQAEIPNYADIMIHMVKGE
ncbi:MAG: ABC transporter ATP-binding protein [Candidatus Marinimicrobia bacterium]|nr:ABC transporter ATP-binding protein [Candidatus Neomarinimicrobiota bacterium]